MQGLAVIRNSYPGPGQHFIELVQELDDEKYLECISASSTVGSISANQPLLLLEKNRLRLRSVSAFYRNSIALKRRSAHFDARSALQNLSYDVLNWLTASRLFVDNHEATFTTNYGKESDEFARLKRAFSSEYDASPAYRVLGNLRDYMQHRGFPAASVTVTAADPELDDWSSTVEFSVDRDALLTSGFSWKSKPRSDLQAMPEKIDILGLIEDASACFRRIYAEVLRVRIEQAQDAVRIVEDLILECRGREGVPHLVEYSPDSEGEMAPRGIRQLPVDIIKWAKEPSVQQEYFDRLIGEKTDKIEMSTPGELDSDTLEALRLGAAILNSYYESGGVGSAYVDRVNAIADDLDDITPIVAGLTTVAAVAMSMAASTLGTDARDLLGGMTRRSHVAAAPAAARRAGTGRRPHAPCGACGCINTRRASPGRAAP